MYIKIVFVQIEKSTEESAELHRLRMIHIRDQST